MAIINAISESRALKDNIELLVVTLLVLWAALQCSIPADVVFIAKSNTLACLVNGPVRF